MQETSEILKFIGYSVSMLALGGVISMILFFEPIKTPEEYAAAARCDLNYVFPGDRCENLTKVVTLRK